MKKENTDINQNASSSYKGIIKFDANDSKHYFNLGNEYFELKQYNIAVKYYEQAIELDSANSKYYFNAGNACFKLKRYDIAAKYYEQAIELDSANSKYYFNAGITHVKLGNCGEVESCYRQLAKLNPDDTKLSNYLSEYIYKEIKKVESLMQYNDLRDTQVIGGSSTFDQSEDDTNI